MRFVVTLLGLLACLPAGAAPVPREERDPLKAGFRFVYWGGIAEIYKVEGQKFCMRFPTTREVFTTPFDRDAILHAMKHLVQPDWVRVPGWWDVKRPRKQGD